MSEDVISTGVIGVGHLGQHHARLYSDFRDVDLVGVVDVDEDRGREIADRHDTTYYNDIENLIPKIQAASVVVPTEDHFKIGRKLIQNQIDCLIEKPMVETLNQAEELYNLARKDNVLLQVGHVERFNTAFVTAREYIDNPRYIEVQRLGPFTNRSDDIGVVMDLMIHDIDILLSLVDSPVKNISAVGASVITDFEDITNARFEFENGCVANLTASRVSPDPRREIRVFQDHDFVTLNLNYKDQKVKMWQSNNGEVKSVDDFEIFSPPVQNGESLRRELLHFVHCIKEDRQPVVGGGEGRDAIKVAFDVMSSVKHSNQLNGIE
ncbi:MAG: Gfo/Idh/MocA family oxidoreductase [bacterium]